MCAGAICNVRSPRSATKSRVDAALISESRHRISGEHHEVIPDHNPIKIKTLSSILKSVAAHHDLTVDELLEMLDL